MKKINKAIQFIVITCFVSWLIAGIFFLFGLNDIEVLFVIFKMFYMFLPAMCALSLQKFHKEKLFRNLNIMQKPSFWFLIAGLIPLIFIFLTLGVNLLFPNVLFTTNYEGLLSLLPPDEAAILSSKLSAIPPFVFFLLSIVEAIIAGYTINAFFAFGEELGWRGYLIRGLSEKRFIVASLIIGSVWGLWHFPLILMGHNYPQHPAIGVGMMIVFCILHSPIMIYIVIKSRAVITAAIYHGMINALAGMTLLYIVGGNDIINGLTGLSGFIVMLAFNILLFIYDKYISKENIISKKISSNLAWKKEKEVQNKV